MNITRSFLALGLFGVLFSSAASAATVNCAPLPLPTGENRYVQVTGALAGGECYRKEGNWKEQPSGNPNNPNYSPSDFEALNLTLLEKDVWDKDASGTSGVGSLMGGVLAGSTEGQWSIAPTLWGIHQELFIGFHFGNGSGTPDSFIVELERAQTSGGWKFVLEDTSFGLNALSNMCLLSRGTCTTDCDGSPPRNEIPEPGALSLVGLGLLAAAWSRRRRS